jgi:dimethylaniline monooxygenase (N-oxide forming)
MDRRAAKLVAVVGAGTSGLAACKHLLARGFRPVVFEAGASMGGLWTRTLASTRLQSPAAGYRFSDFPWPEGADAFPRHEQVVEYLAAYARRFGVDGCVRFRSKVVAAEYVVAGADDAELWAGNGEAFGGDRAGRWRLTVRHADDSQDTTQVRVRSKDVSKL